MKRWTWNIALAALSAVTVSTLTISPSPTNAGGFPRVLRPRTPIEKLAHKIDELQEDIDHFGTVVAKQPDVWGESRLTAHRAEYEDKLEDELGTFKETIQANLRRSDQAFLVNALAIQAALGGQRPVLVTPSGTPDAPATSVSGQSPPDGKTDPAKPATTPSLSPLANPPNLSNAEVESSTEGATKEPSIALEPQIKLDQLSRYLNHLHQLRRINEGDDTADAPGYSMNLMRFPVSVLPGTKTREGYGAEVTFSVTPCISDKLLASTLQSLVINDLLDTLTLPVTKAAMGRTATLAELSELAAEADKEVKELNKLRKETQGAIDSNAQELAAVKQELDTLSKAIAKSRSTIVGAAADRVSLFSSAPQFSKREESLLVKTFVEANAVSGLHDSDGIEGVFALDPDADPKYMEATQEFLTDSKKKEQTESKKVLLDRLRNCLEERRAELNLRVSDLESRLDAAQSNLAKAKKATESVKLPPLSPQARSARYPISSTQLLTVFGIEELDLIAVTAQTHIASNTSDTLHYHNVRSFLAEELDKAWKMLAVRAQGDYDAWNRECPGLANRIRTTSDLSSLRSQFLHDLKGNAQLTDSREALAWAILVDSALLDQQIQEDMQRVAAEQGNLHIPFARPHFWGAQPTSDAVGLFRDYVACKWPIHVFAIDPVTQDQNVADSFSLRREMQLTLSIALASGQINAQEYMQFARRLETDLDTIALNRTVIGFSHGTDTFGWRFQPRVQTPPTESNAKVAFRDLLWGGPSRDEELQTRMLEPGARECVAVVLMPSVLTQVNVDVRSSWYRLDEPHERKFDMEDSVTLGRDVVELQCLAQQCFEDAGQYRHGDVWRLARAVEQLEKQLPLQNTLVTVPNENTIGGTQLFENGRTSLGPELIGFYGQPGVHIAAPPAASAAGSTSTAGTDAPAPASTTLFLVGRNFSVTGTHVTAAGNAIDPSNGLKVLSRELLQVTIPAVHADQVIPDGDEGYIDVHVATPYGVSHHLKVPAIESSAEKAKKAAETKAANDAKQAAEQAAAAAMTSHEETAHNGEPVKTAWKKKAEKVDATLVFDNGRIESFDFANAGKTDLVLEVKPVESIPDKLFAVPAISTDDLELAFWVKSYKADNAEIDKGASTVVAVKDVRTYHDIQAATMEALEATKKLSPASEVKYLKLKAFVRRRGSKAVFAVPGELRVDLNVEKTKA